MSGVSCSGKIAPLGICDHCGGPIPTGQWYTTKGTPRLYCSLDCRNTANSRNGEPIRHQKMMARITRGEWQNPSKLRPPTSQEQAERARKGRLSEVATNAWRNPALDPDARSKLSTPRRHTGILHSAIEKIKRGSSVADLTFEEAEAHREYRRQLRAARRDEVNRLAREWYHRKKRNRP